jgi:hypothetical protein
MVFYICVRNKIFQSKRRLVLEPTKKELENLNKERWDYLVSSFKIINQEYLKNIIQEKVIAILTGSNLF